MKILKAWDYVIDIPTKIIFRRLLILPGLNQNIHLRNIDKYSKTFTKQTVTVVLIVIQNKRNVIITRLESALAHPKHIFLIFHGFLIGLF